VETVECPDIDRKWLESSGEHIGRKINQLNTAQQVSRMSLAFVAGPPNEEPIPDLVLKQMAGC